MTFQLPFEEKIYRQQIELTFKIAWKKYLTETKKTLLIATIYIFLGIIILYGKGNIGGLFIILGIVFTIITLNRFNKYKAAKKTTSVITAENIVKWHENPISIWEFQNDYFRFKFYGGDYKINWDSFKYYRIVDETLFFGFKENGNWYTLSEIEIGKEDFPKVVEFVKSKIQPTNNNRL